MQKNLFIFDIGNVLVNFNFQILLEQISADSGAPVEPPTAKDLDMHHAVEEGRISDQVFVNYINEAKGVSWTLDTLIGVWQRMFTINPTGRKLFCDAIARGLPVYTLSNIAAHHMDAIERNWPGFFEGATGLFLSYQIGIRKPDAGIYRHLLDTLGVPGERGLFIDDLSGNVEAARASGLQAYQFIPENYPVIHEAVGRFFP
jgi:putative hydrolase of the HAD superfamily